LTSEATRADASTIRAAIETPDGRFEFAEHNCFACGTLNAGGLGLDLHVERGRSWTELALERRFEGWENVIHGGILCTILDEVMAWALVGEDNWGVTARMTLDFRHPVTVGLRSGLKAGSPAPAGGSSTRPGTSLTRRREPNSRLRPASMWAAGARRKQDLRDRYAYRPANGRTGDGPVR
jgi:hypothetical protein